MKHKITPEFTRICQAYAKLKGISEQKAILSGVLTWVSGIGEIPFTVDEELKSLLDGVHPFPGRWVKAEERKKTQGSIRPDNDDTCYAFEQFWADYNYKTGRAGALEIYRKLTEPERERIKHHLPMYVASTVVDGYKGGDKFIKSRAMPTSYLNDSLKKYWKGDFDLPGEDGMEKDILQWFDNGARQVSQNADYAVIGFRTTALEVFRTFVKQQLDSGKGFDPNCFWDTVNIYLAEKGKFAGKFTNFVPTEDFRQLYLSNRVD